MRINTKTHKRTHKTQAKKRRTEYTYTHNYTHAHTHKQMQKHTNAHIRLKQTDRQQNTRTNTNTHPHEQMQNSPHSTHDWLAKLEFKFPLSGSSSRPSSECAPTVMLRNEVGVVSVNHGRVRACGREASQGKSPFGPTIPPARSRSAALGGVDLFCGCCCFLGLLLVML